MKDVQQLKSDARSVMALEILWGWLLSSSNYITCRAVPKSCELKVRLQRKTRLAS